ncbi:MAG: phosphoglycerate kinase [Firmicutes bacterium]|nr:phosphoglycerate kinase [Bacillota bacterium]
MKKTIRDYELDNKKVMIRCDFNVPMKDGKITDDYRIVSSLKTIQYALEHHAKVILLSHLGRVKTEEDKEKNSLEPVAHRLSELLNQDVLFLPDTRGELLEQAVSKMNPGDIIFIQNTRYEDLDGKKESGNDEELGTYWASLADIYINDAFGTSHRSHASNVGIASHLPSGIGFLVEKELENLEEVIKNPERPFTVILGGAKVSDKIKVIEHLVHIADHILIGGGMAYTFLKAQGYEIGASLLDSESIDFCKEVSEKYNEKIVLPVDNIVAPSKEEDGVLKGIDEIGKTDMGLDIGIETIKQFQKIIQDSKTVIWNGPVGLFEVKAFQKGTIAICEAMKEVNGKTIVGGGDTASAVKSLGFGEDFTHISTGGGASLELLEGKVLPGIQCIDDK